MNCLEEFVKKSTGETREVLDELVHSLADTIKQKNELYKKIEVLVHENRLLKKHLYGSKSEKVKTPELLTQEDIPLFNEFELIMQEATLEQPAQVIENPLAQTPPKAPKTPGRKPLPSHLPRTIIEHDLTDELKQCPCGSALECIGTQVSEELEFIPEKLQVIEHRCKKYICSTCVKAKETNPVVQITSKTAEKPPQLIPKSFASPSLLARIATAKFCDYLPLYRQENILQRVGIDLSRQTMSGWMLQVGRAIIPLVNLLQDTILEYDVAFADETTVQVLNEPGRRAQTKSYMWCFIGGPPDQRSVVYQYHPQRAAKVASQFFADYRGGLHCDGYNGYSPVIELLTIIGLNCWAHVRRKFVEALPNGKEKGVSGHMVKMIRMLYRIEENLTAVNANAERIFEVRQQQAKPLLIQIKAYLDDKSKTALPSSPVGKAIAYTLKRWPYLINYLEDGRFEIDNNRSERAIKPFVMGRKNWLFANSVDGAHTSARLFSLIETAKANHLNPVAYLEYIFKELPTCKTMIDFEALLPFKLKDNVFLKNSK